MEWARDVERFLAKPEVVACESLGSDVNSAWSALQAGIKIKLMYLAEFPWLFWRGRCQGVSRRIAAKYAKQKADLARGLPVPPIHRIASHFCELGTDVGDAFAAFCDSGVMSSVLDKAAERIHKDVSYRTRAATASGFVHWATSLTLEHNFELYDRFVAEGRADLFHDMFLKFKALVQPGLSKFKRFVPRRIKDQDFYHRVYQLFPYNSEGFEELKAGWLALRPKNPKKAAGAHQDMLALTCDFCVHALADQQYVSLPPRARSNPDPQYEGGSHKVFQVVDMRPQSKKQPFVVDWPVYAVPCMVQHFSVFWGPDRPDAATESLQIFREGAPELMDLLSVTPFRHLADHSVVWEQVGVGEMAGYLRLRQPRRVIDREWPGDARTPVYVL